MTSPLTENPRDMEFLLSEGNGSISRTAGTVASGQNVLKAGTVCQISGGKLIVCSGTMDTNLNLVTAVCGILCYEVDATSADKPCVYISRLAEVKDGFLVYPTESSPGGEKAAVIASLKTLNIIVR